MKAFELISFQKATFSYQKKHPILNNFSATIFQNSLVLLKGKNGSGKSTLLKLLLNDEYNLLKGKITKNYNQKDIGYVAQHVHRKERLPITLLEFLLISCPELKKENSFLSDYLKKNELWHKRNQNFSEFSGGEKQKAYILRSLLMEQKILLMDEPLSYLDQKSEKNFAKLIEELLLKNQTIILATHQEEWMKYFSPDTKKKFRIDIIPLDAA